MSKEKEEPVFLDASLSHRPITDLDGRVGIVWLANPPGSQLQIKSSGMKEPISAQIVTAAGALFYREGIRAVGIDRIIEEANVAKATLYRHFPSKDHLVAAYLEDRHRRVIHSLQEVLDERKAPRDQIQLIFERLHEKADSPEFRGCAFALAVAEHGDSERVVSIARTHKKTVKDIFRAILSKVVETPDQAVAHLSLLYEGALATVAVERDPNAVLIARDCALSVFDAALHSNRTPAKSIS